MTQTHIVANRDALDKIAQAHAEHGKMVYVHGLTAMT